MPVVVVGRGITAGELVERRIQAGSLCIHDDHQGEGKEDRFEDSHDEEDTKITCSRIVCVSGKEGSIELKKYHSKRSNFRKRGQRERDH